MPASGSGASTPTPPSSATSNPVWPEIRIDPDVAPIFALLGELATQTGDLVARRRRLLRRLAELVDADHWLWATCAAGDNGLVTPLGMLHSGLDDGIVRALYETTQDTTTPAPEFGVIARIVAEGAHTTLRRSDLLSRDAWIEHPHVRASRLPHGLDEFVLSVYPVAGGNVASGVGLYRGVGREGFDERERDLVHMVMNSVAGLHEHAAPNSQEPHTRVDELTPRQRTVLGMLINGWNRKQIASSLGLSPYTVADHMKAIYKHFDVNSQRELLRLFMNGEMHD